jgi:putative phage-type endonuclease
MSEQSIIQAMLDRCSKAVRTDMMPYEEWLELRKGSIGGSDAGSLMLLNGNWGTPFTVFGEKKGWEKSKEMSIAAKRGKLLEPIMRGWFAENYPDILIAKVPYMFYSDKYPFMSANVDGLIEAKKTVIIRGKELQGIGGLEIKSSKYGYDFGEDEIPDSYYAQIQHYMVVMGIDWFILYACFLDTEETQVYVILRDEEFIQKLVAAEKEFWEENYIKNVIPAAIGLPCEDDMITGMYNGAASTLNLTDKEKDLCGQISRLKEQISRLEKQKEAAKINLKTSLGTRAKPSEKERKLSAIGDTYNVTWSFVETKRLDTDAIKKAGLYDRYCKVTTSDRLTVSVKKGA